MTASTNSEARTEPGTLPRTTTSVRRIGALLTGLWILASGLGGCGMHDVAVPIMGEAPTASMLAVEVLNPEGRVRIDVVESLTVPEVLARTGGDSGAPVSAEIVEGPAGRLLRVVRTDAPPRATIDVTVRVPRCDGVAVRNGGGPVTLVGVGGPISVENGGAEGRGGGVTVRTSQRLNQPIDLSASEGPVRLQMAPGSAGRVDATTGSGRATVRGLIGSISDVVYRPTGWTGVINGGTSPFRLRAESGDVSVWLVEDPEGYTFADR